MKITPEEKLAKAVVRQWARDLKSAANRKDWRKILELGKWLDTPIARFWCDVAEIPLKRLKIVYNELLGKLSRKPIGRKRAMRKATQLTQKGLFYAGANS